MNDEAEQRLAIAIGSKEIKLLWVEPEATDYAPAVSYEVAEFTTFTDVLMNFERQSGRSLVGARCAISVAGATHGQSLSIARGRWTISRSGLGAMFGRPVEILNEVAASAWALVAGAGVQLVPLGAIGSPDFRKPGRWVVVYLDEGVGLAAIDVATDGATLVLECEAGHGGFAPETDEEDKLLQALRRSSKHVTWEQVITLAPDDPVWTAAGFPAASRARTDLRSRAIGSFVGDTILSLGAWSGAILTGRLAADLSGADALPLFSERVENKGNFRRLMREARRWRMAGKDLALAGAAASLSH